MRNVGGIDPPELPSKSSTLDRFRFADVTTSPHSAAPSALGYLYQTQWPLLELLQRGLDRPDAAIMLELHDDVSWEEGSPTELIQVKHHQNSTRVLGDKDSDWWRTIRAWMQAHEAGDPNGPLLTMVTTLTAGAGTAAAALRPESRDPATALALLEAAAAESRESAFADTRERFLNLDDSERSTFVSRMFVLDARPTLRDLDGDVRRAIGRGLPRDHADSYMGQLWYWWHTLAIQMLTRARAGVSAVELDVFLDDLRDQYGKNNLPTLVPAEVVRPAEIEAQYGDSPFVHQLRWVDAPPKILQKAIVDYYRAYTQQARWLDDDLIGFHEIEQFERNLVDEWEREFEWASADTGIHEDAAKVALGQELLRAALDQTTYRVRERYDEPFFSRGKHHELANTGRVGWHPDFRDRLQQLLLERAA
jgi:hypothetical protein